MRAPETIIRAALKRISNPERWCARNAARNARNEPVPPHSPEAVRWCAMGALQAESTTHEEYRRAKLMFGEESLIRVNDKEGHQAVLDLFDAALGRAELLAEDHR